MAKLGFANKSIVSQWVTESEFVSTVKKTKLVWFGLVISVYLSSLPVAHLSEAPRRQLLQRIVQGYRTKQLRARPGSLACAAYSTVTRDLGLTSHQKNY